MVVYSLILASAIAADPQAAAELTARHELLLDDHLLASQPNVVRRIHPAAKHAGPVLRPSEPWEANSATIYGSVIRDGRKYRMGYLAGKGTLS